MSETVAKARALLAQQIEELGSLRNASTRDPQFKQWRQNTLTVIQRIWPDEPGRSERFRRVPFSPPQVRHDTHAAREHFERGCGEALEYLNLLLRQVEESGVAPAGPGAKRDVSPGAFEDDYPTLELSGGAPSGPAPEAVAPPAAPTVVPKRSVGPPPIPAAPAGRAPLPPGPESFFEGASEPLAPREDRRPSTPPPPPHPMRVSVRKDGQENPEAPPAGKANPLEDILSSIKPAAPAPPQDRGGRRGRKGGRGRLKDMLGFTDREAGAKSARPAAPTPGPARLPEPPARLPEPPARRPPQPLPAARESTFSLPEFQVPAEPMPLTSADIDAATPAPVRPAAPELSSSEAPPWIDEPPPVTEAPPWIEESAPVSPIALPPLVRHGGPQEANETREPEPVAPPVSALGPEAIEPSPAEAEPDDAARVTAEFLLNSPVLSSQARPVARRVVPGPASRETPLVGSSASSQLMQLATEVDSLGVPEGQRALARAFLMDLARLIETGVVSWDTLRDAVQMVMQFPPLARRALPLLLPYLDQAA